MQTPLPMTWPLVCSANYNSSFGVDVNTLCCLDICYTAISRRGNFGVCLTKYQSTSSRNKLSTEIWVSLSLNHLLNLKRQRYLEEEGIVPPDCFQTAWQYTPLCQSFSLLAYTTELTIQLSFPGAIRTDSLSLSTPFSSPLLASYFIWHSQSLLIFYAIFPKIYHWSYKSLPSSSLFLEYILPPRHDSYCIQYIASSLMKIFSVESHSSPWLRLAAL